MENNLSRIKANFKKDIENRKNDQLQEVQKQIEIINQAKARFVTLHELWKRIKVELKQLKENSKELNIDVRAAIASLELKVETRKTNCENGERIFNIEKEKLKNLTKKHKEQIQAIKHKMFLALEQERERQAREKAIMGEV